MREDEEALGPAARAAHARAVALETRPWEPLAPDGRKRRRLVAVGDPQTTLARYLRVLERHGLLGTDGWLLPEVGLVSIGDHFDFEALPGMSDEDVGREGQRILRWLAAHPPDQTVLLLGNHDTARVMELAHETEESWRAAKTLARVIEPLRKQRSRTPSEDARLAELRAQFEREHPHVPTSGVAARDFLGFEVAQRRLVQDLLRGGRFELGRSARLGDGRPVLLTHASVTRRELERLGLPLDASASEIAAGLRGLLVGAVARSVPAWERGHAAALELAPLHFGGRAGLEGGGLLYQRPVNPDAPSPSSTTGSVERRRYDARELPSGLLQVCGHTGHSKSLRDLAGWETETARAFERGGLRTLVVAGGSVRYQGGVAPVPANAAGLYMIDAEVHRVDPEGYPVFELGA